jgi:hypothetical protein
VPPYPLTGNYFFRIVTFNKLSYIFAMTNYNVQEESKKILLEHAINDSRLGFTPEVKEACERVKFVGRDGKPYLPTPLKMTESISALSGLVGALSAVVAKERYGIQQSVTVNTYVPIIDMLVGEQLMYRLISSDKATLFLMGMLLPQIDGQSFNQSEKIRSAAAEADKYLMVKPIHLHCTNIYQCKDGRWYHVHASMNANPTMEMLGIPEIDVTKEEAIKLVADKVMEWDSEEIDRIANENYKEAGTICYTPEEFFSTPQVDSYILL